jgi:hypothetical protein
MMVSGELNSWILYGWWPSVLDFAKMIVYSFWWILAASIAAFVILIFGLIVKLAND